MQIGGSAALVAGGASGLGEAAVRRLHAGGAHVVIADVQQERGRALAHELGERTRFFTVDVTDPEAITAFSEFTSSPTPSNTSSPAEEFSVR